MNKRVAGFTTVQQRSTGPYGAQAKHGWAGKGAVPSKSLMETRRHMVALRGKAMGNEGTLITFQACGHSCITTEDHLYDPASKL